MKLLKKLLKYFVTSITILLFALSLAAILISIKANKDGSPAKIFGYSYSIVVTGSMEETIHIGDFIVFKDSNYSDVKEKDIIVFYSEKENKYIVHRVIDILDSGALVTKGDNPYAPVDSDPVTENNYYGIVIAYGPLLNFGTLLAKYRNLAYLLLIVIFLAVVIYEGISVFKQISSHKNECMKTEAEAEKQKSLALEKEKLRKEIIEELNQKQGQ
jgi:signal peptidase